MGERKQTPGRRSPGLPPPPRGEPHSPGREPAGDQGAAGGSSPRRVRGRGQGGEAASQLERTGAATKVRAHLAAPPSHLPLTSLSCRQGPHLAVHRARRAPHGQASPLPRPPQTSWNVHSCAGQAQRRCWDQFWRWGLGEGAVEGWPEPPGSLSRVSLPPR